MEIKNRRNLTNVILGIVLLGACIFVMVTKGFNVRYVIGLVIALAFTVINLFYSSKTKEAKELLTESADERDLYNAMKSSQKTLQITNTVLFLSAMTSIVLYGVLKGQLFMVIAITLAVVIILIFIILLICNHYYEKYN